MLVTRIVRIAALSIVALVVAAGVAWYQARNAADRADPYIPPVSGAEVGGAFALIDQTGGEVTHEDFLGRYALVYFGYTFCPDICPTTLYDLARLRRELSDLSPGLLPDIYMVSVDVKRDTPAVMARYVTAFNESFTGLTGEAAQLEQLNVDVTSKKLDLDCGWTRLTQFEKALFDPEVINEISQALASAY